MSRVLTTFALVLLGIGSNAALRAGTPVTWDNVMPAARSAARASRGATIPVRAEIVVPLRAGLDVETELIRRRARSTQRLALARRRHRAAREAIADGRYLDAARAAADAALVYTQASDLRRGLRADQQRAIERLKDSVPRLPSRATRAARESVTLPMPGGQGQAQWRYSAEFRQLWLAQDSPRSLPTAQPLEDGPPSPEHVAALASIEAELNDADREFAEALDDIRSSVNAITREARDKSLATRITFGGGVVRGEGVPYAAARFALDAGGTVVGGTGLDEELGIVPQRISRLGFEVGSSFDDEQLTRRRSEDSHVLFLGLSYLYTNQLGLSVGAAHHESDVYPYGAVSVSFDTLAF